MEGVIWLRYTNTARLSISPRLRGVSVGTLSLSAQRPRAPFVKHTPRISSPLRRSYMACAFHFSSNTFVVSVQKRNGFL